MTAKFKLQSGKNYQCTTHIIVYRHRHNTNDLSSPSIKGRFHLLHSSWTPMCDTWGIPWTQPVSHNTPLCWNPQSRRFCCLSHHEWMSNQPCPRLALLLNSRKTNSVYLPHFPIAPVQTNNCNTLAQKTARYSKSTQDYNFIMRTRL